jgi:hypothetical protein
MGESGKSQRESPELAAIGRVRVGIIWFGWSSWPYSSSSHLCVHHNHGSNGFRRNHGAVAPLRVLKRNWQHLHNNVSKAFEKEGNGLAKFHIVLSDGRCRSARGGRVGQITAMPGPQLHGNLRSTHKKNNFFCARDAGIAVRLPVRRAGYVREQRLHHRRPRCSFRRHVGRLQE